MLTSFVTADSVISPARKESRKRIAGDCGGVCLPNKSETCFISGTDRGGRTVSEADFFFIFWFVG